MRKYDRKIDTTYRLVAHPDIEILSNFIMGVVDDRYHSLWTLLSGTFLGNGEGVCEDVCRGWPARGIQGVALSTVQ